MIHKNFLSVIAWALIATAVPLAAAGQNGRCPAIGAPAAEIPFTLIGDPIYIEVRINGTGPYRFIVDTGGVNLVDVGLANQLSLKITGSESGQGTGPETVESGKTTVDRLTVGNISFTGQSFYTFDLRQLYAGGGVKMMGMVGAALFRQYATCIDFNHKVIELIEPARLGTYRAGSKLAMTIQESELTVPGSFDGIPGVFQIDTGSPTTLTLAAPFVAQHQLLKRFPQQVETSSGGVGGATREYVVRGKDLVLGAERIQHPITALAAVSKGKLAQSRFSGIIGIGALKRYVVTFDFRRKFLYLQPYKPTPADLDSYDRSGMRIEIEQAGFRVVSVAPATPAAEAGLHTGDVIVTVDGRLASSITLPGLREELSHRPAGSVVALGINSEGERRNVRITLRDLL